MSLLLILFLFAGIFTIAVLGIFLFSFIRFKKSKTTTYKVLVAVTGAYLIIVTVFFSWRITDMTIYPKVIPNSDGTLIFEGNHYIADNFDEFPYGKNIKRIATVEYSTDSKAIDFANSNFFPSRLFFESGDFEKKVLCERALMLELKYKKID